MKELPDTPMEDVTLQRNSISLEMVHSDTVLSARKKKKKKSKRGKKSNALANIDLIQQAIDGTCLVKDSRIEQHDVEVKDCDNIQKTGFSKSSSSNDININSRDSGYVVEIKNTVEVNVNQVPEANVNPVFNVAKHDDQVCSDNGSKEVSLDAPLAKKKRKRKKGRKTPNVLASNDVQSNSLNAPLINGRSLDNESIQQATTSTDPIHKVVEDDDLACTNDVSEKMVTVPLQPQKTKRKRKKKNLNPLINDVIMPNTSLKADSELMQHNAEQGLPQKVHQNECATKDKNCSGNDSSGIIDTKVNEISVSQGRPLGNIQGVKKRKRKTHRKNLNLEPKEGVMSSTDLSKEQEVEKVKLNADQNADIGNMLTGCVRKKLLVLDLNGLLADVVGDKAVEVKADGNVAGKKIFKRPFCDDFLQFCFQRFTVGVWSSRRKENVDKVIKVLMRGNTRSKLAFVWNQSHCTRTGFQTIENREKPLFLKELSKLWKNRNSKFQQKVREYDESNTLLLDDSPYKALKNPPYTAIFPTPYQYQDRNDNALGPGGDLRVYLEGLALAEDVQEYVEQNPFGQKPITKSDPSWSFYTKVIRSRSMILRNGH